MIVRRWAAPVLGLLIVAGGSTYLSGASHAADANAEPIAQGLQSFTGALAGLDGLDELADPVALSGLLPSGDDGLRLGSVFADSLGDQIATRLSGAGFDTMESLEAFLDDPDGANGADDDGSYGDVDVDVDSTISSLSTGVYDVTLTVELTRGGTTPLDLPLAAVDASGGSLTKDLDLTATLAFQYDAAQPAGSRLALLTTTPQALTASLDLDLDGTPYVVDLGLTEVSVSGTADIGTDLVATLVDPTPNGRISQDDWEATAALDLFDVTFGSSHANLDLTLTSDIPGVPTGTISLADSDLSTGIGTPAVALGALADFTNMTPIDFLGGLAQVAGAFDALQLSGPADFTLPLMKDRLSEVLVVNSRLKDFFTSTGLSHVDTPLTLGPGPGMTVAQYEAILANYDTLQEIQEPLALSLGVPVGILAFAFNPDTRRINLTLAKSETRSALTAEVDLANQLERLGVVGVEDAASEVDLTPTVALDVGVGVDLTPRTEDQTLLDKVVLETDGVELAVDAPLAGNLDMVGKIGFLGLDLEDGNATGNVPLLERADNTLPMLSVDLDGGSDDLLTLSELFELVLAGPTFTNAAGSIEVDVNAEVPSFDLLAAATAGGSTLGSGRLTVSWPDVTVGAPTVVGDTTFNDQLLDFDFDHSNPLALFSQVTAALRTFATAVDGLAEQASGEVLSRDLPFAGQSFDDVANKLGQVSAEVDALLADPPATLQVLESRLEDKLGHALGIAVPDRSGLLGISRSTSGPTSLLFDLSYGLCSTDSDDGCTQVTGPLQVPFNFDLGEATGGIVGTEGAGTVSLNYEALTSLDFGVELPAVTGGSTNGSLPTVVGAPSAFVLDTSAASLTADLVAGGTLAASVGPITLSLGTPSDPLEAKVAAGITLDNDVAPAGLTRIPVPSAAFDSFVSGLVPTDIGPATGVTCAAPVGGPHDACARIPVYEGTDLLGEITLTWADLTQLSGADGPQLTGADDVFAALIGRGLDFDSILDGMQRVLVLLTDSLKGASYGQSVPVVGDALDAGANIAELFETEVVTPLQQLKAELNGITDPAAIEAELQQFFVDALALSDGTSLLRDRPGTPAGPDKQDVVIDLICDDGAPVFPGDADNVDGPTACTSSHNALHLYDVQIAFAIGQTGSTGTPVDFDLGLPGLRLEMTDDTTSSADDLRASATWDLDLAFGLSVPDGFYLRTDNPHNVPSTNDDELTLDAGLELPDSLRGDIAFLPFTLTDRTNPSLPSSPKDLNLTLGLDLKGGGPRARLALTDLVAGIDPGNDTAMEATLGGNVNLDFEFVTGPLGTEDSHVPTFRVDFLLNWDFSASTLDGATGNLSVNFNNVRIDLGSLLGDFLEPILTEASRITKPLKPVVDIVTAPIPGLTDAAAAFGCPAELSSPPFPSIISDVDLCKVSLLDVYEKQSGTDLTLIRQLISLINFINAVDEAGSQPTITLGSFSVNAGTAKAGPLAAPDKHKLLGGSTPPLGEGSLPKPLEKLSGAIKNVVADAKKEGADKGGFTFPAFDDPSRLFTMLLGQDVTLIHWDAGALEASVTIPLEIGPPIGPLPISLGITIQFGVRGHFAVGYDTKGIRLAVERLTNDDPDDNGFLDTVGTLFAGIGIDDRLRVNGEPTGEDIPEITLFGSLTAKAALDLLLVEAGVRGGVEATLDANLHDGGFGDDNHTDPSDKFSHHPENLDGVLRLDEIASFLGNPVCLFDYSGRITAFLEAYIDYTLGEETFTIVGPVTIYDFSEVLNSACEVEPVLAHVTNDTHVDAYGDGNTAGDLVLHSGVFAEFREFQEDQKNERFVVRQLDAAGTKFSVTAFGFEQEYSGVTGKIFADGGDGNDTITLEPGAELSLGTEPPATGAPGDTVNSTVMPFTRRGVLCGGPGTDVLITGSGSDNVYGDGTPSKATLTCDETEKDTDGVDDISTGGGNDIVFAGGGNDKVSGGDGEDLIQGQTGDDVLIGGAGAGDSGDVIRGGPDTTTLSDKDTVFGGPGPDSVDGGADRDTIDGGDDGDALRGGPGDDTIQGRLGNDVIRGEGDDDSLHGAEGDDDIQGGSGDDDLFGDDGDDLLSGGADDDDIIGGRDNTGDPEDTDVGDTVNGDAGKDYLLGDEGTIERPAGTDTGTIACTGTFAGDDALNGGADDDLMLGCAGVDVMHGDGGADVMHGSDGDDDMFGDDGTDTMFGDKGADEMEGNADDDVMRGGHDGDVMKGNDGVDTMFGDSGEDVMYGNAGNDVMRGNADDDHMEGNADSDTMNGDGGDDLLIGGTSTAGRPDAGDVMNGGIGEDHLIGDNGIEGTLYDLDAGDDTLGGSDEIDGGPDNDEAFGGLDDDIIRGGAGEDHLEGNNASDTIHGEAGSDNILGGTTQLAGGTTTYPDEGDDIFGGDADDVILGDNGRIVNAETGQGTPILRARGLAFERTITLYDLGHAPDDEKAGDDTISGGDGPDVVLGQGEVDTLHGNDAADLVAGGQAGDTIYGGIGQDDLIGGSYELHSTDGQGGTGQLDGRDTVYGGADADVILGDNGQVLRHTEVKSAITQNRAPMTPRLVEIYDLGDTPVAGTSAGDWLLGEDEPDVILGQSGTDRITAGSAEDYAEGGPGTDWIEGNDGDDDLVGGSAVPLGANTGRTTVGQHDDYDVIWGGADDDLVIGDNAVVDRVGTPDELTYRIGTNPVQTIIDRRAIQLLDLVHDGDTLTHDASRSGGDYLSGQGGVDVLLGQDGADRVSGGSSDDYVEGHGAGDTINGDAPLVGVPTTLAAPGWPGVPTDGYAADDAPDGQDDLLGGKSEVGFRDGVDTIHGDGESDFVLGDNGTVVRQILGEAGALMDRVYALRYASPTPLDAAKIRVADSDFPSTRFCDASLPECERAGASGGDSIYGDGGDDFLYGQDGDDSIWGGSEDDDIYGELGNDTLFGEAGDDAILGDRGGVRDRYESGTNTFNLSVTQVPKVSYEGFSAGSVTRITDLLHDVNGDAFVGSGASQKMPHNGRDVGGVDRIRGGLDDDSIHAGFGDDLANGDSGGDIVFGDDGADVLWGGKGCDAESDTVVTKPECFRADGTFDPAPHRTDGSTVPSVTDYLLGGKGGTSTESLEGANGSDLLDWRPRGSYDPGVGCTTEPWPLDLAPVGKKGVSTTIDPCSWFEMTDIHDADDDNNQHHQGIDWQYGGWDRDVLQGDEADNGPNEGDRLLDWDGAYNLYTHCNAAYGGFNDVRQHSPTWQDFLQRMVYGLGAGQAQPDAVTGDTSAFVELALVYPGVDRAHGSGRAYPATPGHFDNPNACAL